MGPVANRIGGAAFEVDGEVYHTPINDNGHNTLHGGFKGVDRRSLSFANTVTPAIPGEVGGKESSLARTLCLTHTANAISVGVVGGMESSLAQKSYQPRPKR